MSGVDISTEIVIDRPRAAVAAFASDPDNAPLWYVNIKSIEWKTSPPMALGSRMAFVAHFLGRRLAYTYEVVELVPGERVVMKTQEGPFPMETTHRWDTVDDGRTRQISGAGKVPSSRPAMRSRRPLASQDRLRRFADNGTSTPACSNCSNA